MNMISEELVEKLIKELMLDCDEYIRFEDRMILAAKLRDLKSCDDCECYQMMALVQEKGLK